MTIETINPATGELIQQYSEMSETEIASIIDATHTAFLKWRETDFSQRASCLHRVAEILRARKDRYAELIAHEMGKPLLQGRAEIEKCAVTCEYYRDHAAEYLQPRVIKSDMRKSYVTYQPLGVLFAIMPWNFPFWQVFRFAAPNLMAGNAILLKHAPISTGSGLEIETIFREAGCIEHVFRTLVITEQRASDVIAHAKIQAVTLTGSTRAGKLVAVEAAKVLKKTVLELGGSDPYLILEDADVEVAAEACVNARMNNAGQSCIAAKRLIVVDSLHATFVKLIQEKLQKYKMGNPLDEEIQCGPLARHDLRDTLHAQVQKSMQRGATLLAGGVIPKQRGFYYPPTLLINVKKGMPAFDEELFGPVIAIITAKNEEEAIALANDTPYGLGAAIFTKDIVRGEKIAVEKILSGTCSINTSVASDPRLPFGGIKQSGHGRELSAEGMHAFVNIKTINIK